MHIIILSYNLEYFTVVEITGLSKRPNRTKNFRGRHYLVSAAIWWITLFDKLLRKLLKFGSCDA
jgi:hypothetical protein